MEPVTLTTPRLLLRPFAEQDADAVFAASQDPDIRRWIPLPEPYERGSAEEFVGVTCPAGWREDTMYNFGVFTHDGTLTGSMGLVRLERLYTPEHQAELGFWTAPGQRRRGFTAEAGQAVIDWAFDSLGVERLEWVADVDNAGSLAVAQRLGFTLEGVMRARVVQHGVRRDARIGALLATDTGRRAATPHLPPESRA
ncbi:GNAT family N-acetyltransferase [Streptomyces sp. HNM0574]|uniref:GNAT family N-acetyltransferase n=1 Tax=Streptomyces sp. HNM0574 TaxID=2714954 RepID=UPI00146EA799|nr:GNAT family N-acetyltransferase [Streptomyces sp. HNM0574]NLU67395.1 GNAT family N-acetyltransferase [Streptomyces sp. HNM0574]